MLVNSSESRGSRGYEEWGEMRSEGVSHATLHAPDHVEREVCMAVLEQRAVIIRRQGIASLWTDDLLKPLSADSGSMSKSADMKCWRNCHRWTVEHIAFCIILPTDTEALCLFPLVFRYAHASCRFCAIHQPLAKHSYTMSAPSKLPNGSFTHLHPSRP